MKESYFIDSLRTVLECILTCTLQSGFLEYRGKNRSETIGVKCGALLTKVQDENRNGVIWKHQ